MLIPRGVSFGGLEPTYEGLKLEDTGVTLTFTESLEPTYEGLKAVTAAASSGPCAGLEPTYEGLKRSSSLYATSGLGSCLEPTYEGLKHIITARPSSNSCWFGAYL